MWNLEGNQEIDDQDFAEVLKHLFENDMKQSREINYESWRRRPWYRRLQEHFWGRVDILLHRLALWWRHRKG